MPHNSVPWYDHPQTLRPATAMSGAIPMHAAEQRTFRTWSRRSPLQRPIKIVTSKSSMMIDMNHCALCCTHGHYEPVYVDAYFAVAHLRPAGAAATADIRRGHPDGLVVRRPLAVAKYVSAAVQSGIQGPGQQSPRSVAMSSRLSLIWTYDVRIAFAYTARLRSATVQRRGTCRPATYIFRAES